MANYSIHPQSHSLRDFVLALEDARSYADPDEMHPYKEARVLCLHFEHEDDPIISQDVAGSLCDRVSQIFREGYGYKTETYKIKSHTSSQTLLASEVTKTFSEMDSDCLVIIYYIGNAAYEQGDDGSGATFLQNTRTDQSNTRINFTDLRRQFIDCQQSRVLLFLDCCYAPVGTIRRHKETIAASGEAITTLDERTYFTLDILGELEFAITHRHNLSTAQLYARMADHHFTNQLQSMPEIVQGTEGHRTPTLLKPMHLDTWTRGPIWGLSVAPATAIISVRLELAGSDRSLQTVPAMQH
jgi:hypothetical protein